MPGLLAYRIWAIERNVASIRATKSTMKPIFHAIVDAALLYSATLFTALVCFVNSNHGEYVVVSMVSRANPVQDNFNSSRLTLPCLPQIMPIISIVFYVVLIRIAMRRMKILHHVFATLNPGTTDFESQGTGYVMSQFQVHISQFSRSDGVEGGVRFSI